MKQPILIFADKGWVDIVESMRMALFVDTDMKPELLENLHEKVSYHY